MFYVDLLTKQYIEESSVVKETDNGIVYYENGCWKYLPNTRYEKVDSDSATYAITVSEKGEKIGTIANAGGNVTQEDIFYTNYFGISKAELSYRKYRRDSGIVMPNISVTVNKPIKLLAEMKVPSKTSVELYIIDGNNEVPILSQGEINIVHERVFPGIPPRFESNKYSYFRDFTSVGSQIPDEDLKLSDSLFTVCYTPSEDAHIYTPLHSSINIKAILRMYEDDVEPPTISSIVVSQEA
jgi:hypothetical protein